MDQPIGVTVDGANSSAALTSARTYLRSRQAPTGSVGTAVLTEQALEMLHRLAKYTDTDEPNVVRRGAYKYYKNLEDERIARATAITRRVEPGPAEDPTYFALLAYQAASLETAMNHIRAASGSSLPDPFASILLGTAHVPQVNAFSHTEVAADFSVTVLYSGLVDFVYQAAKAVAEAVDPHLSSKPSVTIETDFSADNVNARLDQNASASDRLYRTLESYFFYGYPRAFSLEYVPDPYHPFLSLLVSLAERWMVGHEYGHSVSSLFGNPSSAASSLQREVLADAESTVMTVYSAGEFDLVPPEFPIGSAMFALKCLEIVERAFGIVTSGTAPDIRSTPPEASHPCPRDRADNVVAAFRQFFDVVYLDDHRNFELSFVLRKEPPSIHGFGEYERQVACQYADTLELIWHRARVQLAKDYNAGRPLHHIWHTSGC